MKYKRNYEYESMAEVEFEDGSMLQCECRTGTRGKLRWIKLYGVIEPITEENLEKHKIVRIHFMTPNTLTV